MTSFFPARRKDDRSSESEESRAVGWQVTGERTSSPTRAPLTVTSHQPATASSSEAHLGLSASSNVRVSTGAGESGEAESPEIHCGAVHATPQDRKLETTTRHLFTTPFPFSPTN